MAERLGEATGSVSWPRGRRQPARCTSEEFPAANGQTHVNDREGNPFNWLVCVVHGQPLDAEAKAKHA